MNDCALDFVKSNQVDNQLFQQTSITKNDTVTLGGYDWTVLDIQCDRALSITKEVIEKRAFHARNEVTTWEQCSLRSYLNGVFYSGFSECEKQCILETAVSNCNNPEYGTNGGNPTTDKVFLLSIDEANQNSRVSRRSPLVVAALARHQQACRVCVQRRLY